MKKEKIISANDFKGIGFSKIGHFKEVRSKIKELERLNIELARRTNKLEAIFNSMSDGLTILDQNLSIIFANQVQKNMFSGSSLTGKKCYQVFFRKEDKCAKCPALRTMETCETLRGETLIREGEFAGRYYEWTTSPIMNHSGTVEEIIYLMRDITDRKEYEFKLMEADRMAAIGFLAAGVAHEINNPLTSIAGFSEGLLKRLGSIRGFLDDKKLASFQEYLEIINSEVYRCRDIIRNLLEFSRESTDDYEIISIDQVINDTLSLIRQHARDNNISTVFKNSLASGLNQVSGNESQLKHVFLSLFHKIFRNMEHGGNLAVTARNNGNEIEIFVSETRTGKSELSEQISDTSQDGLPEKETTLNLSICYNIIKNHKGDIRFDNRGDKGINCILHFPVTLS